MSRYSESRQESKGHVVAVAAEHIKPDEGGKWRETVRAGWPTSTGLEGSCTPSFQEVNALLANSVDIPIIYLRYHSLLPSTVHSQYHVHVAASLR